MSKKIRILLGKVGGDTHDRGVKFLARALSEAGMEVIYTGIGQNSEQIVNAAVQEDVDVLGISCLGGGHMTIFPEILKGLKKHRRNDMMVLGGGVIPYDEGEELKEMGVKEFFRAGTPTDDIINYIRKNVE